MKKCSITGTILIDAVSILIKFDPNKGSMHFSLYNMALKSPAGDYSFLI